MALFGDESTTIRIAAKDDASKVFNTVNLSMGKLVGGFALGGVAANALNSGLAFLSGQVGVVMQAFKEQEAATTQLNAVLASTGGAAGMTAQELIKLSEQMQRTSLFSDDMALGAENILLTFTNIGRETFPQATQAALDMSQALGQDLKSSSIQLGKALQDPIQGVSALQRVGVSLTPVQETMIKNLVKQGDVAGAQKVILAELNKEFGGSAKAASDAAGSIEELRDRVDDAKEAVGGGLTMTMRNLVGAFMDTAEGADASADSGKQFYNVFSGVTEVLVVTGDVLLSAGAKFLKFTSYIGQAISIVGLFDSDLRAGFTSYRESLDSAEQKSEEFVTNLFVRNQKTRDSWDTASVSAGKFAASGASAYQQTAEEAEKASKKITEANEAVADTEKKIAQLRQTYMDETVDAKTQFARAYVDQELKVKDLKKQVREAEQAEEGAGSQKKLNDLRRQLEQEQEAYQNARSLRSVLNAEIMEEKRRDSLTDFEREVEDIRKKTIERTKEFMQKMSAMKEELLMNQTKRAQLSSIETGITNDVIAAAKTREKEVLSSISRQMSAYESLRSAMSGGSLKKTATPLTSLLSKYETGGTVPGPVGMPVPIIAHGQETIIPAGKSGSGSGTVISLTINNPVIRNDTDLYSMKAQLDATLRGLIRDNKLSLA